MNANDRIERLRQKKLAIEREIAKAEATEKRRAEVAGMAQAAGILALPDAVLRASFAKLASENAPKPAQNPPATGAKPAQNPPPAGQKPAEKGGQTA